MEEKKKKQPKPEKSAMEQALEIISKAKETAEKKGDKKKVMEFETISKNIISPEVAPDTGEKLGEAFVYYGNENIEESVVFKYKPSELKDVKKFMTELIEALNKKAGQKVSIRYFVTLPELDRAKQYGKEGDIFVTYGNAQTNLEGLTGASFGLKGSWGAFFAQLKQEVEKDTPSSVVIRTVTFL